MTNSTNNNSAFVIKTPAEFSFKECLTFLGRSDKECLHKIDDSNIIKLLAVNGKPILFSISESDSNELLINVDGSSTEQDKVIIENYIIDWFDLSFNL